MAASTRQTSQNLAEQPVRTLLTDKTPNEPGQASPTRRSGPSTGRQKRFRHSHSLRSRAGSTSLWRQAPTRAFPSSRPGRGRLIPAPPVCRVRWSSCRPLANPTVALVFASFASAVAQADDRKAGEPGGEWACAQGEGLVVGPVARLPGGFDTGHSPLATRFNQLPGICRHGRRPGRLPVPCVRRPGSGAGGA